MNNKTGYGLRIVVGGYLAYLGIRMLIQTVNDRPANMIFMAAMAVIFAVVGIAYAVYCLKKVWKMGKEDTKLQEDALSETDGNTEDESEAAAEEQPEEQTEEIENDYEEK